MIMRQILKKVSIILLFGILSTLCLSAPVNYTVEDLQILETEKNYKEFFQHALDIRPVKRDDKWQKMVLKMAESYTKSLIKARFIEDKSFITIENLAKWPLLKTNEFFQSNRRKIGLKYLEFCYQKSTRFKKAQTEKIKREKCNRLFISFWENIPTDYELGLNLLELTNKFNIKNTVSSWTLIKNAVSHPLSEFYCKKMSVRNVLWNKIVKEKSAGLITKDCLLGLKPFLIQMLYSNKIRKRNTAYKSLNELNVLSNNDKDFYLTLYFLDSPKVGTTFNNAWNTLRLLGQNFKRRELILNKLQTLDPLPGKLFNLNDTKKKKILIKHLFNNIPEYLNIYGKECINYYKGIKNYPKGTPTPYCKKLFQLVKGTQWIAPTLQKNYLELNLPKRKP